MNPDSILPPLDLQSAAAVLGLPSTAVDALVAAGYLSARRSSAGDLCFGAADLESFVARNADEGSATDGADRALAGVGGAPVSDGVHAGVPRADDDDVSCRPVSATGGFGPEQLAELLDRRAELMARRVLMMFSAVFPEAASWSLQEQSQFLERARSRFESVLAVAAAGDRIDESVYQDLRRIGASAARSSADLRQTLFLLRMSRDLVVQNAVELAGGGGGGRSHALSLLLTRILPAMDRLSDAVSGGYWEALFGS